MQPERENWFCCVTFTRHPPYILELSPPPLCRMLGVRVLARLPCMPPSFNLFEFVCVSFNIVEMK